MARSRILGSVLMATLLVPAFAIAQPASPSDAVQVQQLQKELSAMREQMAAMQKTIDAAKIPADQKQTMMGHMGMMQNGWQGMHQQCCMMNPAACPGMQAPQQ